MKNDPQTTKQPLARQAYCTHFGGRFCWSCDSPYYTGHYATKREALEAARAKAN